MSWFSLNKYTALILVLMILLVCYYVNYVRKNTNKKGGKIKKSRKQKNIKASPKSKKKKVSKKQADDEENEVECDDEEEEDNINKDAEELYNLAHDGLCNGIQQEEFEEIAGDLASTSIFIELKQAYNQCRQKGMDPNKNITVEDYIQILKEEDK